MILNFSLMVLINYPRMKISITMDMSIFRFYGYIGNIGKIISYILTKNLLAGIWTKISMGMLTLELFKIPRNA